MANQTDKQIMEEGWRNVVVRFTATLTDSDLAIHPLVKPSDFQNNDSRAGTLSGFRVDHVSWTCGDTLEALLSWNANTPEPAVAVSRSGKLNFSDDGGISPNSTNSGYDGSINLDTKGFNPGSTQYLTLLIRLVKLYKNQ